MDKKRKAMVDVSAPDLHHLISLSFPPLIYRRICTDVQALVQREEDAKKAKVEQAKRHAQALEEESIKEAGRRMLEEAQKRQAELAAASARASGASNGSNGTNGNGHGHGHGHEKSSSSRERNGSGQPPITPLDLTLILQFPSSSTLAESSSSSSLQNTISSKYGPVSHVLLKEPPAPTEGKKKKKGKKAIVEFEKGNWGGCWACWNDHDEAATGVSEGQVQRGLEGVKAKWAAGSAPAWVEWASNQSKAPASDARSTPLPDSVPPDRTPTAPAPSLPSFTPTPSFGSAPSFGTTTMADLLSQHSRSRDDASDRKRNQQEYESLTLLKMRQMERERLAEQIRLEEGDD